MRVADRSRLDAFHCRSLRKLLGIGHSMFSRIPNTAVLEQAGLSPLTKTIKVRQLLLFGRVAMMPETSVVRQTALEPNMACPRQLRVIRKRGRPRLSWANVLYAEALSMCDGNEQALSNYLTRGGPNNDFQAWRELIRNRI